tara:strand:- start:630 stop:1019 length:390 start_codon:yes stop_codon:yes gene_type:complete
MDQQNAARAVHWIQCDDKIKAYNEKCKSVRQIKENLGLEILQSLNLSEISEQSIDKQAVSKFNIEALQTSIVTQVSNTYESYTNKFYRECFTEFLGSEEKADELIKFMKSKRKVERKITLKREKLTDLS